jgi:hypothetical protein
MKQKLNKFWIGFSAWLEEYGKARAAAELARCYKYQEAIKIMK